MIPLRNELPEDAADWVKLDVKLPYLSCDAPESCPIPTAQVFDYVIKESADTSGSSRDRMIFARTALVENNRYWLWRYVESDGMECFVVVRVNRDGHVKIGLSGSNGLSPEQYLLADHFDEIYWS